MSLHEEGVVMSASYHRHKEQEKGFHLLLFGLFGGTEIVYSPDKAKGCIETPRSGRSNGGPMPGETGSLVS